MQVTSGTREHFRILVRGYCHIAHGLLQPTAITANRFFLFCTCYLHVVKCYLRIVKCYLHVVKCYLHVVKCYLHVVKCFNLITMVTRRYERDEVVRAVGKEMGFTNPFVTVSHHRAKRELLKLDEAFFKRQFKVSELVQSLPFLRFSRIIAQVIKEYSDYIVYRWNT